MGILEEIGEDLIEPARGLDKGEYGDTHFRPTIRIAVVPKTWSKDSSEVFLT